MINVKAIIATSPNCAFSMNDQLPWKNTEELAYFKQITINSTVVMGRKTWESLLVKPLPNRKNIIVSSQPTQEYTQIDDLYDLLLSIEGDVWIIGGKSLIDYVIQKGWCKTLYISRLRKSYKADVFFHNTYNYILVNSKRFNSFDALMYEHSPEYDVFYNENVYINLVKKILKYGRKKMDRTRVGTLSLIGEKLEFDLRSFPLLTTKRVAWKSVQEELQMFIQGKTNTKELEEKNVNIWKAHTSASFLQSRGLDYDEGEMGPMYGYQWRNFNGKGIDQLKYVVNTLKDDPESRRILMTTFNPEQVELGVLWPCHGLITQFFCRENEEKQQLLTLVMYQRSCDVFLGLPFNIASYACLAHIIAKQVNMIPDKLIIMIGDAHIYNNHIEQLKTQIERPPLVPPQIECTVNKDDIEDYDITLNGYFYHPSIKGDIAV